MTLIFCNCCGVAKPESAFRYPFSISAKAGLSNCSDCYDKGITPSQERQHKRSQDYSKRFKRGVRLRVTPLDPAVEAQDGRYKFKDLDRPE